MPEKPAESEVILYKTEDGRSRIQVRLEGGTVWLTQVMMADLFQTSVPNINIHISFALAADYVEGREETQVFFATMQNKST